MPVSLGPMTKVSDQLKEMLNKAIAREIQVSVQYMWQHVHVMGVKGVAVQDKFKQTAISEMKHAENIAERLWYLGGTPTTKPDPIVVEGSLKEFLENDTKAEEEAISPCIRPLLEWLKRRETSPPPSSLKRFWKVRLYRRRLQDLSLLTHLLVSKYVDHHPVYRQLEIFQRQQVDMHYSTVSGWIKESMVLIEPVYNLHCREVLKSNYLNVDETTIKVLDKDKKGSAHQGYYWVYYDTQRKLALFDYRPGVGHCIPKPCCTSLQDTCNATGMMLMNPLIRSKALLHYAVGLMRGESFTKQRTMIMQIPRQF